MLCAEGEVGVSNLVLRVLTAASSSCRALISHSRYMTYLTLGKLSRIRDMPADLATETAASQKF